MKNTLVSGKEQSARFLDDNKDRLDEIDAERKRAEAEKVRRSDSGRATEADLKRTRR